MSCHVITPINGVDFLRTATVLYLMGRHLMSYPDHLLNADRGLDSDEQDSHKLNVRLHLINFGMACIDQEP